MSGRLVPWVSWREWERVRGLLFAEDANAVQSGLSAVTVWRRRGKLPLGADVTAMLLATSLKDPHGPGPCVPSTQPTERGMEASLQTEYSLTIIRLVNGVSDSCQKGKVAGSVSKNADSAGLHPMLVDVRHEATHNQVPSLHMLRLAASHALSWLYSQYWSAQTDRTWASASDAVSVFERLVANQAARAAVSAASGQSSQHTDSDADVTERSDEGASPAALKKQQKALLGELRPIYPSSHAADLAITLLHAAATRVSNPSASTGPQDSKGSTSLPVLSVGQGSRVSTLALLDDSYTGLLNHMIVQAFAVLKDAKAASMLHSTAVWAASDGAHPAPSLAHSAAVWAEAALKASEGRDDLPAHQQHLAHALNQLFQPSLMIPATLRPHQSQQPSEPSKAVPSHPSPYAGATSAALPTGEQRSAVDVTEASRRAAVEARMGAEWLPAHSGDKPKGQEPAVMAMLETERMLLQMCEVCGRFCKVFCCMRVALSTLPALRW